jgi:O-antigen/teichoic acid export membrane protein
MSALQRFVSASAAAWVKVLITALAQIVLVPVFLSHWSVQQYGCWLIIQSIVVVASLLSLSYQNFIGFELLKIGEQQPASVRVLLYSALPYVLLIALLELLLLVGLICLGLVDSIFDARQSMDGSLLHQALGSLLIYSLSWLLCSSVAGLAWRALAAYGYFPRVTWWSTLLALVAALTSGVAVVLGADLIQTVGGIAVAGLLVNIPLHLDLWRLLRRHGLYPVRPDWRLGRRELGRSLAIAATAVLDMSRLQGVRILLGELVGITQMTAFATLRTINNLSLQGVGTITNPMMPEMMRVLRARDSQGTGVAAGVVWFLAVALLAPVLMVLQWIMPAIFRAWTRGKVPYSPALFGLFSISVLLFSLARPLAAVLQGYNLLRAQLLIAILMGALAVSGILALTPAYGVLGAGASMLLSEMAGTALTVWFAGQWLQHHGIAFPSRLFAYSLASIAVAAIAIALNVWLPQGGAALLCLCLIASCALCVALLRQLPSFRRRYSSTRVACDKDNAGNECDAGAP